MLVLNEEKEESEELHKVDPSLSIYGLERAYPRSAIVLADGPVLRGMDYNLNSL